MPLIQFLPSKEINFSDFIIFISSGKNLRLGTLSLSNEDIDFVNKELDRGSQVAELIGPGKKLLIVAPITEDTTDACLEKYRRTGALVCKRLNVLKEKTAFILSDKNKNESISFAEGLVLANYKFSKYKPGNKNSLEKIALANDHLSKEETVEFTTLLEAVYKTRDLVNEPVLFLTAEQFSEEIVKLGKESGFETEVFNKSKIQSLKMGGLLAVNAGSPNPPTFNILEYKPANAVNKKPYILVGKGVVYDTGGLSLKPTEHSMDMMKCDMAGGAAVAGTFYAVAKNKLPIYIIGLIPATENRPDGNAVTPGDIITMHDGKTVEVLNTDAEGRLILADALSYAKKYDPELVIDLATLTGSAVRAIGKEGIVYMGTADKTTKEELESTGMNVFERLVEFPLWDDYDQHIQSEIADLKNIGGPEAGAITAGKFLQHFTSYPWLHLDIAGGAFMTSPFHYWISGGTGLGVRLLYRFLKNKIKA
jgi:leucyl aminopeptidase